MPVGIQVDLETMSKKPESGSDDPRRLAQRADLEVEVSFEDQAPVVEAEVTATSEHNFFMGFSENLSEGGLFIATHSPREVGALVSIEFTLPGLNYKVCVVGEVRWTRLFSESSDAPPGMGVRFIEISDEDAKAIRDFVNRRAPIFWD